MPLFDLFQKIILDFLVFYSIFSLAIFIIHLGIRTDKERKLRYNWFLVFCGMLFISFVQLASIAYNINVLDQDIYFFLKLIFILIASMFITFGISSIISEKYLEYIALRNRYLEIKDIMLSLKEKLLKGKISKKEFDEILKDLVKEETEIEVKLKRGK